jgi:acyl dehydratase
MALLTIDEIKVGDSYAEEMVFDAETIAGFIQLTADTAGIHVHQSFSREKKFDDLVVHGFLLSVRFSRILGMELPGEHTVIGSVELNFHAPVYVGDRVKHMVTVTRILKPLGGVLLALRIEKANGAVCAEGKASCVFKN